MGYGLDNPDSIPSMVGFFSSQLPDRLWGLPNLIQRVPVAISPGVKWPGSGADHSPPSSAEVKNNGPIPPLPHMSSWHSA
jgi:hypothetical protein